VQRIENIGRGFDVLAPPQRKYSLQGLAHALDLVEIDGASGAFERMGLPEYFGHDLSAPIRAIGALELEQPRAQSLEALLGLGFESRS
jgi:hypothetical protein